MRAPRALRLAEMQMNMVRFDGKEIRNLALGSVGNVHFDDWIQNTNV